MGRLISPSKPKASAPQIVYYTPSPVATPAPSGSTSTVDQEKTQEQIATEKAENLLRRNRSRLGTVLTSFRGVLSQNDLASSRKTLLGE
jgi:hypothetical protein